MCTCDVTLLGVRINVFVIEMNKNSFFFDIHMSVHHNIIPSYSQRDASFLDLFILQTLYKFQAVPQPIIRIT